MPLASLAKKRSRKKATSKRKSASPKRRKTRRPALRVYGLDGKSLENDVTHLQDFLASHTKELPAKVGFVMLGAYPIMIENKHSWARYQQGNIMLKSYTHILHKHSWRHFSDADKRVQYPRHLGSSDAASQARIYTFQR